MTPPRACRIWSGGADFDRVAVGFERFLVAPFAEQHVAQLELDFDGLGLGRSRRRA